MLHRLVILLFLLTQVTVAAAVPVEHAVDSDPVSSEHCADHEAAAEDGAAPHVQCDDGCQQCAACAPAVATGLSGSGPERADFSAAFRRSSPPAGALTALLRPPSYS